MDIKKQVIIRLKALGYMTGSSAQERAGVRDAINRAERWIKNETNQKEVPLGLLHIWAGMAAAMYLSELQFSGKLDPEIYDFDAPAKTITEGDTSVTFFGASDGVLTPQARFNKTLENMQNPSQSQLAAYRRIRW
jgi:hypothetical protein